MRLVFFLLCLVFCETKSAGWATHSITLAARFGQKHRIPYLYAAVGMNICARYTFILQQCSRGRTLCPRLRF
jgi:hypothetical protein